MVSNTLGICTGDNPAPRNAAVLLSPIGPRLALRYELRKPFATWLARRWGWRPHAHGRPS